MLTTFGMCLSAGINAGIVTTIWAINPLFGALFDKIIFGQNLTGRHFIGVGCLIVCAALISLSGVITPSVSDLSEEDAPVYTVQPYVPVILALITPIFFTSECITMKYLTKPQ